MEIQYVGPIVPYGFHYWNTWADGFWNFAKTTLSQPVPFNARTGLQFLDMSDFSL